LAQIAESTDIGVSAMSINLGLEDVHVLVTGAAGGIGLETVHIFRQLGARVTAHYNSNIGELASLKDIVTVQADVRNESGVKNLLDDAAAKNGGPVSVLIVNHGIWPTNDAPIADMELDQWSNTLAVNLTGPFLLCRQYLKALRSASDAVKDTANIVFIGSTAGKFGEAGHGDYSATKSALMYGLTPTVSERNARTKKLPSLR
jgi:NAD(P)-dependent dehydrogenase (short-subunit alcohol dehydrogenase family)